MTVSWTRTISRQAVPRGLMSRGNRTASTSAHKTIFSKPTVWDSNRWSLVLWADALTDCATESFTLINAHNAPHQFRHATWGSRLWWINVILELSKSLEMTYRYCRWRAPDGRTRLGEGILRYVHRCHELHGKFVSLNWSTKVRL